MCVFTNGAVHMVSLQARIFPASLGPSLLGCPRPVVKSLLRQQAVVVSSISVWTMCQMGAKLLKGIVVERTGLQ